jgi:hypothetical protein
VGPVLVLHEANKQLKCKESSDMVMCAEPVGAAHVYGLRPVDTVLLC